MELTKLQQEIREKLIIYALTNFKKNYSMSHQDIGDIFSITRQAVHKIEYKNNAKQLK